MCAYVHVCMYTCMYVHEYIHRYGLYIYIFFFCKEHFATSFKSIDTGYILGLPLVDPVVIFHPLDDNLLLRVRGIQCSAANGEILHVK